MRLDPPTLCPYVVLAGAALKAATLEEVSDFVRAPPEQSLELLACLQSELCWFARA